MEEIKIIRIIISCFVHSTESTKKVTDALMNLIPNELKEDIILKKQSLEGHYGNPITILNAEINDEKLIDAIIKHLSNLLKIEDKQELSNEFTSHLDNKGNFYLRLDKQHAYMKEICIQQQDPIKIKMKLKKSKRLPKEFIFEHYQKRGLIR